MNTYSIMNRYNDMVMDTLKNKQLYSDIDDSKDAESDASSRENQLQYDESVITEMIEKYLADREKVIESAEDSSVLEEEEETESELDAEEEEYEASEYESESEMDVILKDLGCKSNELIINSVMELYKAEFGKYPSLEMLEQGLSVAKAGLFGDNFDDYAENEYESDNENISEFCDELEDALLIAGDIGSIHQVYLVNKIMDTYYEINDEECELDELKSIMDNIEIELKNEASDELLDLVDISDSEDDEEDEDYRITRKDIRQGKLDDSIDLQDDSSEDGETDFDEEEENVSEEDEEWYSSESDDSDYDPDYDEQNYDDDYELYR